MNPDIGFTGLTIWLRESGDSTNILEFHVNLNLGCNRQLPPEERSFRFPWEVPAQPGAQQTTEAPSHTKPRQRPVQLARKWRQSMDKRGESRSELARRLGVSRARVTQVLKILDLDPALLTYLERNPDPRITERALRALANRPPDEQRRHIDELLAPTPQSKRRSSEGRLA